MAGEAGVDEAGCGSLMGDLVAAAVILPDGFDGGVNDSKKRQRAALGAARPWLSSLVASSLTLQSLTGVPPTRCVTVPLREP